MEALFVGSSSFTTSTKPKTESSILESRLLHYSYSTTSYPSQPPSISSCPSQVAVIHVVHENPGFDLDSYCLIEY